MGTILAGWAGALTPARWLSRRTVGNEAFARCPPRPSRPRHLWRDKQEAQHKPADISPLIMINIYVCHVIFSHISDVAPESNTGTTGWIASHLLPPTGKDFPVSNT